MSKKLVCVDVSNFAALISETERFGDKLGNNIFTLLLPTSFFAEDKVLGRGFNLHPLAYKIKPWTNDSWSIFAPSKGAKHTVVALHRFEPKNNDKVPPFPVVTSLMCKVANRFHSNERIQKADGSALSQDSAAAILVASVTDWGELSGNFVGLVFGVKSTL